MSTHASVSQLQNRVLTHNDLWPRDNPEYKYRIYRLYLGELEVLAACPDAAGIGVALVTMDDDLKQCDPPQRLADAGTIGVLDVMPDGKNGVPGEWIIKPFTANIHKLGV